MTKTCTIEYRGRGFWAYDESLAILLYVAADMAESPEFANDFPPEIVKQWRVVTFLGGNVGLDLNDVCDDASRRERFVQLISTCAEELRVMGQVNGDAVRGWRSLGEEVIWRGGQGDEVASTMPIVELATAIVEMVQGDLPPPPSGHWWFVGTADGSRTIAMREGGRLAG